MSGKKDPTYEFFGWNSIEDEYMDYLVASGEINKTDSDDDDFDNFDDYDDFDDLSDYCTDSDEIDDTDADGWSFTPVTQKPETDFGHSGCAVPLFGLFLLAAIFGLLCLMVKFL